MAYPGSSSDLYRETEGAEYNDWEGYSTDDVLVYNPYNSGLDLAGLQKDLTWQNQDNTGLHLTKLQKDLPWQNQGVAHFSPAASRREKKRLYDKSYHEREKLKRKKMESDLVVVGSDNKYLKGENGRLRSDNDVTYQSLKAIAAGNQILKTQVRCLKRDSNQQQVLVDAFSRKQLLKSHEGSQLLMLRQERDRLLGNVAWTPQMEEQKQLLERIVNLELQNRALKFQVQALCEKIDNDKNHE
ncbi:uncharacterized protein LOC119990094 isoform X2 [Tripterygium wilfordii]|uniref:uncharacterized protein LOC119990094 isoform X2 n=1 Tax=Tripterygium wilfordii TaxID=458696 RepID=UPI0018F81650|nr:uncharacterized protein LOC119990094 isoform X2 [Tripterygium wilfordii]XP_038691851.1 uncharacterized protein LOC119990094 isoform X2 [Tripterygium wilfordii]XP_038691852.1 uncharacterized protein LOC119990094 isoform X2 [Tripterygium wilfordii]